MSTTTRRHPGPASLDFDPATDPARGRHLWLAMPWHSRIDPNHEDPTLAGQRVTPGFARIDQALIATRLPVNLDHDPRRRIGTIAAAEVDDAGIWVIVDLTPEGERELARSNWELSAETLDFGDGWVLSGCALLSAGTRPAIPGSRAIFSRTVPLACTEPVPLELGEQGFLRQVAAEADRVGGRVQRGSALPSPTPTPMGTLPMCQDVGESKALLHSFSMAAVACDVQRDRRRFELQHQAYQQLADPDQRVKDNLLASMTPVPSWPLWTRERRGWEDMQARHHEHSLRTQMEDCARDLEAAQEWLQAVNADLDRQHAELNRPIPERTPRWTTRLATRLRPSAHRRAAATNPSPPSTPTPANTPAPSDPGHTATPSPA